MTSLSDITIRIARPEDAGVLDTLTADFLGPYKVQWEGATPDWLVAEVNGEVLGCTQLCIGRPIGRIEMLSISKRLDLREKHAIMVELCRGGLFALQQTGSQIVTVFVSFDHKGFKRLLKKRFNGRVTNSGNLLTSYLGV